MTRISTFTSFNASTFGLMEGQAKMAKAQQQASSQMVASDLKGYGNDAKRLINAKAITEKLEKRNDDLKSMQSRAEVEAAAFTQYTDVVDNLRQGIMIAVANRNAAGLRTTMENALASTIDAANTEFAGQSIFGGVRAYDKPLISATLDTLAAQPNTDPNWVDTGANRTLTLEDGRVIELSQSAQEVFKPFVDFIRSLRVWENTNTPLTGTLNDTQVAFLQSQIPVVKTLQDSALEAEGRAGITNKQLSNTIAANEEKLVSYNTVVGNIENVDLAEVSARLSAAQTQYQASASIFSQLKNMNLLQYLR